MKERELQLREKEQELARMKEEGACEDRKLKERELQLREKEQELARKKEEGASEERKMLLKFLMENTKK